MGYFKDGQLAEGDLIIFKFKTRNISLFRTLKARPNGKLINCGTKFFPDMTSISGYFDSNELLIEAPVEQLNRDDSTKNGKTFDGLTYSFLDDD